MTIGRRLNQLIHWCVAISMSAYALAAEQPGLLLIVLALLGLEFAIVSRIGGRHLPRWAINTALAVATIAVAHELMTGGEGREFVSVIGRYLIWLQFIKLAEPKTARNLGQALALTAMLAVGAVLTNVALIVGVLLLVYIPLFLASVVVFQLYAGHVNTYGMPRELAGMVRPNAPSKPPSKRRRATPPAPEPRSEPDAPIPPASSSSLDRLIHHRWTHRPTHGLVAGRGLARNLIVSISMASIAILAGSIALFLLIPRGIGESFLGGRLPTAAGGPQISGFSPDLQLGGTGVISESSAIALYVRFSRAGNIIGSSDRTWHLRGFVMDRYDPDRGRWIRSDSSDRQEHPLAPGFWMRPDPAPRTSDLVQEITIRNNRSEFLFSVFRPVRVEGPDGERIRDEVIRPDGTIRLKNSADGLILYTVRSREGLTTSRRPEPQSDMEPDMESEPDQPTSDSHPAWDPSSALSEHEQSADPPAAGSPENLDPAAEARRLRLARWKFQEGPIAELAANIAEQAGITLDPDTPPDRERITALARAIERHLSSRCAYTLDQPPLRDNEDPIEAFLFRTRAGHCEYFASASAALASAMRIPSRVVTGFHVSEWDPTGRRYIVRESSAHAWAEVEVEPGNWIVIDPSADDVRQLNRPPTGLLAGLRRLVDQVEFLWVSRVVTFDSSNQREMAFFDFTSAREWLERVNRQVAKVLQPNLDERDASSEPAAMLRIAVNFLVIAGSLVGVLLLAVFIWRAIRRSAAHTRRAGFASIADPAMRRRLRFYSTMLERLNKLGQPKPDWQPPARHAAAIKAPALRHTIERLTALYYADRFGGQPLTEPQRAEAEQLLRTLDNHNKPRNDRP